MLVTDGLQANLPFLYNKSIKRSGLGEIAALDSCKCLTIRVGKHFFRCGRIFSIDETVFSLVPITMGDEKHEYRLKVKFLVKLKKTLTESYKLLREAYGENFLSRQCVFEKWKRIAKDRKTNVHVDPVLVSTSQTVTKINEIVRGDNRMNIWMIVKP